MTGHLNGTIGANGRALCGGSFRDGVLTHLVLPLLALTGAASLIFYLRAPVGCLTYVPDDTFLYFQTAKATARAGFFTFDGMTRTNGFHPLWQAILLIGSAINRVAAIRGADEMRVYFILQIPFHLATALLLYVIASRYWTRPVGLVLATVWATSAYYLAFNLSGMETAVNALALITVVHTVDAIRGGVRNHGTRMAALCGVVCATAVFARLENGLLVPFLAWIVWRTSKARKARLSRMSAFSLAFLAPVCIYLVASYAYMGRFGSVSGATKLLWNHGYVEQNYGSWMSPSYALGSFLPRVAKQLAVEGTEPFTEVLRLVIGWCGWTVRIPVGSIVWVVACGGVVVGSLLREGAARFSGTLRASLGVLPGWFFVFAGTHLVVSLYLFPMHTFWWAFAAQKICALFLLGAAIALLQEQGRRLWAGRLVVGRRAWRRVAAAALVVSGVISVVQYGVQRCAAYDPSKMPDKVSVRLIASRWLDENLPEGTRVGSLNSGLLGFLCQKVTIVNLDGLVNDFSYLDSQRRGTTFEWMRQHRVDYLAEQWPEYSRDPELRTRYANFREEGESVEVRRIRIAGGWFFSVFRLWSRSR